MCLSNTDLKGQVSYTISQEELSIYVQEPTRKDTKKPREIPEREPGLRIVGLERLRNRLGRTRGGEQTSGKHRGLLTNG